MRVWELASGKEVSANDETHHGSPERIIGVAGGLVATASDDFSVRLWEAATGKQRLKLTHDNWVRAIAVSPDGTLLASSSVDDTVRLWNGRTGREIYRLAGHGERGGKRALGFTPDGKRLVSWGDDLYLRVWDVARGKALAGHKIVPAGVKVPEDEDADHVERYLELGITAAAFTPDGRLLVLGRFTDFRVFDVASGKEVRTILSEGSHVTGMAFSPDGKLLLASAWGKQVETKLPDGRVQVSTGKEHPLGLWDLTTDKLVRRLSLPGASPGPVAVAADGKTCAAAVNEPEGKIRLWDTATGEERPAVSGFRGRVTALAFTPDGRYLIAGMSDTTALIWDLNAKH